MKLERKSMFKDLKKGTNPPRLILISGVSLTGKSTLAKFLKSQVTVGGAMDENQDEIANERIKIVSTDSLLEATRNHINAEDEPILHVPAYQCEALVTDSTRREG